ncbi:MAG: DUF302 domain-containing protein [Deltaproteobacteria bacterium]|nr:DUF302 domain-containing protein [Deltaproteobacteria bacterium]
MAALGLRKVLESSYEEAVARLPEALSSEGFGVLTEIDVKETLRKKLGVDFRRYKIVGACNPPIAHEALQANLGAGVMMPCNVVVYEADDGRTVVEAVDPLQTAAAGLPELRPIAETVRAKLERCLARLG